MNVTTKIVAAINSFIESVKKFVPSSELRIERKRESKTETLMLENGENGSCVKYEIHHDKSHTSFFIGFLVKKNENKPELFISVNDANMLSECKCFLPIPSCNYETPGNKEGETWYTASESINNEYFSETTPETRKDEIIEQILSEVVKSLNENNAV